MKWIAVEPLGNSTARESGLTSIWSSRTREFGQLAQEAKQMTAELSRTAGAVSRGQPRVSSKCVSYRSPSGNEVTASCIEAL